MAVTCLPLTYLTLLATLDISQARDSCPDLADARNNGMRVENVQGRGAEKESEFLCPARWNWEHMREKVQFMLKNEEKKFVRFRTPVCHYSNPRLGLEQWSGTLTWIWAADQFDYMLYYPQNFQTLSLGTTDIIVSNMKNNDITIDCTHCDNDTSCGVGYFELKALIKNVSDPLGIEWDYLCVEADGGVTDIVSDYPPEQSLDMLNTRNFALPDILYQSRFLKLLYSKCSFLTFECKNVANYFCYDLGCNCIVKEVLSHYNVIVYLAIVFWLYSPILVFYLPSSQRTYSLKHITEMFPTYKTPVYFGRCIQDILCYHMSVTNHHAKWLIRVRRFLFLTTLSFLSFRLLLLPPYRLFSCTILGLFIVSALWPQHISVYIEPQVPQYFPFPFVSTPYPAGIIKWGGSRVSSIEFQKLSYIMLERIYMTTDYKFWVYLVENSFSHLQSFYHQPSSLPLWLCKVVFGALAGLITLSYAVAVVLVYFLVPMPYFVKELFRAIQSGVYKHCSQIWNSPSAGRVSKVFWTLLSFLHGTVLEVLLIYFIMTVFSLCFLLTEVTIFTYIGASIAADKVLHYFILIVAMGTAVYTMIHAIHKQYSSILKDAVFLFEIEFDFIKMKLAKKSNLKLTLEKSSADGVVIKGKPPSQFSERLYVNEHFISYINSKLYFSIVENLQPIRRQVLLLVIKLFLMVFFVIVSMWVKNVYKNENQVSDIFSLAGNMAVYFVPSALQFLSSQSQFGRRMDTQQRMEVVAAIMDYVQVQSSKI